MLPTDHSFESMEIKRNDVIDKNIHIDDDNKFAWFEWVERQIIERDSDY